MSPYQKLADDYQKRLNQELKNYQTEIYKMNQSIQQLKAMLVSVTKQQEDHVAKTQSQHKALEIEYEHFTEYVKEEISECKHVLDGHRNELQKVSGLAREAIDQSFHYIDGAIFDAHRASVHSALHHNQAQIDAVKAEVDSMCNRYTRCTHSFAKELKLLDELIPDLKPVHDYIDKKLQENAVNIAGFVKELEICKNRISYGDKKFENIYTLIERLKGK